MASEEVTVALGQATSDIGKGAYPFHILKYSRQWGLVTYCKEEFAIKKRSKSRPLDTGCTKCKRKWKKAHA